MVLVDLAILTGAILLFLFSNTYFEKMLSFHFAGLLTAILFVGAGGEKNQAITRVLALFVLAVFPLLNLLFLFSESHRKCPQENKNEAI